MPKLRIIGRQTPPASQPARPQQRLMAAGPYLYRTTRRPDAFCWYDEPEGDIELPQPRRKRSAVRQPVGGRPTHPHKDSRAASPRNESKRKPRRDAPPVADVPADAFIAWLGRLYGPRGR